MSAAVVTEYLYYAACSSCNEGTEILDEDDAQAWVDQHNAEQHAACGGGWVCNASLHVEGCLSGDPINAEVAA